MAKQIILSIQQREKGLINLIEDAQKLGFNGELIQKYKAQLSEVQSVIQADKDKKERFNKNIIERGFKLKNE